MAHPSKVVVKVATITNEETGEVFVLMTDADLVEQERRCDQLEAEAVLMRDTGDGAEIKKAQAQEKNAKDLRNITAMQRANRDKLMPLAEVETFTLLIPTWKQYLESEAAATTLMPDGTISSVRMSTLMTELLPQCVEGMKPAEVNAMPQFLAGYLWERLYRAIRPDPFRISFSVPPSVMQ